MRSNKHILLVEDDKVDAMTVKRAFKDLKISNELHIVENGVEALEYLRNTKDELPCLVLLDLNMPKMNGIEFLKEARKEKLLDRIPVVVLTTSEEDQDRIESFNLGVSGYMLKPVNYMEFVEVVRTIDLYWTLSLLPDDK